MLRQFWFPYSLNLMLSCQFLDYLSFPFHIQKNLFHSFSDLCVCPCARVYVHTHVCMCVCMNTFTVYQKDKFSVKCNSDSIQDRAPSKHKSIISLFKSEELWIPDEYLYKMGLINIVIPSCKGEYVIEQHPSHKNY